MKLKTTLLAAALAATPAMADLKRWGPVEVTDDGSAYYTSVSMEYSGSFETMVLYAYPTNNCDVIAMWMGLVDDKLSESEIPGVDLQLRVDYNEVIQRVVTVNMGTNGEYGSLTTFINVTDSLLNSMKWGKNVRVRMRTPGKKWSEANTSIFPLADSAERITEMMQSCAAAMGRGWAPSDSDWWS